MVELRQSSGVLQLGANRSPSTEHRRLFFPEIQQQVSLRPPTLLGSSPFISLHWSETPAMVELRQSSGVLQLGANISSSAEQRRLFFPEQISFGG
nr:hypothetical protein Iba_chr10aCG17500 [Ipomoea batatas]GMD95298.1 hypothetical protein Iba_chr15aCG10990 [Ipomoea batatas]